MTDAPERIWTWDFCASEQNEFMRGGWFVEPSRGDTEYIRADIHEAEVARLRGEVARLRKQLRVAEISVEAMAEVKATSDGLSDQPIANIVAGALAEIAALGDSHER